MYEETKAKQCEGLGKAEFLHITTDSWMSIWILAQKMRNEVNRERDDSLSHLKSLA